MIHNHLIPLLDAKSMAYLGQTCREIHIRIIADKRWEDLVKNHFAYHYRYTYSNLASHVFYKIYCVEAMFAILEKKSYQNYDSCNQTCTNISGNICLWLTFTLPTIKMVAVIIKACKTGNVFEAIDTIL